MEKPMAAPPADPAPDWTPYGIVGYRRRWRLNWRLFAWLVLNGAGWMVIYAATRWL
jgi:hypothetical protein